MPGREHKLFCLRNQQIQQLFVILRRSSGHGRGGYQAPSAGKEKTQVSSAQREVLQLVGQKPILHNKAGQDRA